MKFFTKGVYKFSLLTFIVGIIITITAVSLGANITRVNLNAVNSLTDVTQTYTDVKSLNIDLAASEVEIKTGDEFKIVANNVSKNLFKTYVEDGIWYVKDDKTFSFLNFGGYNSKVTIYVPESFNSENLRISMGAGKFSANNLNAKTTEIEVGAGDLRISNLTTDEIDVECGVGNIEIGGIVNNKGDIESGVGNVSLELKGNKEDYNYDVSLGVGEVILNGSNLGGFGDKVINNTTSDKYFKVECGIGKFSLNIK